MPHFYELTLTYDERAAINWVGHRYSTGDDFRKVLWSCENDAKEECPVIYGFELTDDEKKDFDYHSPEDLEEQTFVKYRNNIYDISQFIRLGYGLSQEQIRQGNYHPFGEEWNDGAYYSETYYSGVLCKILDEETIMMAQYCS